MYLWFICYSDFLITLMKQKKKKRLSHLVEQNTYKWSWEQISGPKITPTPRKKGKKCFSFAPGSLTLKAPILACIFFQLVSKYFLCFYWENLLNHQDFTFRDISFIPTPWTIVEIVKLRRNYMFLKLGNFRVKEVSLWSHHNTQSFYSVQLCIGIR